MCFGPIRRRRRLGGVASVRGSGEPRADTDEGAEPDPRFTFASERTFLAWSRTALALVAAGLAVTQLLPPFPGVSWGRRAIGVPLIVLGAAVAVISYVEWSRDQRALRTGKPLHHTHLPLILSLVIAAECLLAAALVIFAKGV
ncbi:YidH family protein [Streptomyces sp. NPDC001698]|uniref:YidH family protein n=1 Tax=Streptomyces sp. NPDC001698 TaxID=3364601 RepID=UPI0036B7ECC4